MAVCGLTGLVEDGVFVGSLWNVWWNFWLYEGKKLSAFQNRNRRL